MKKLLTLLFASILSLPLAAQQGYSTAGFFVLDGSGRDVYDMDAAWRFALGDHSGAETIGYDDSAWEVVSVPHGLEYLPTEASGCTNYQGQAWYRKRVELPEATLGKRLNLYFEAVMGKCKIWVNGTLAKEHFGGFLPISIDITDVVKRDGENIIAVWVDNSDDPDYPPGKEQGMLDFAYFGGIYRDVLLIAHNDIYITDPNAVNMVAGGGLFVNYDKVSDKSATVNLKLNLQNDSRKSASGTIKYDLRNSDGKSVATASTKYNLKAIGNTTVESTMAVPHPQLWSPDSPNLYKLNITLTDAKGNVIDGYTRRIGIRSISFNHSQGFVLNGKQYPRKLIGANRHQDFAVVGNALANSTHWRDAFKLKQAGMDIIRNAHYPQDPAFMDACEELGLFVIVNTPGWQFWNEKPIFEERVYSDIRNMVRRDRNSPSVIMWEPILNETWYPEYFAEKVNNIVKEEYPYPGNYTACDLEAKGSGYFDIIFTHPSNGDGGAYGHGSDDTTKVYFTREWGDNVDDWNSHNSPSRVNRAWGEIPMIVQAQHYAAPEYQYTCYETLYKTPASHFGGTLWHSFDHQRGYHPDPFYGGIMDVFRRPKYSYYMFRSQMNTAEGKEPVVYIAHEMTPFSPKAVTVYSNCDSVVLTVFEHGKKYSYVKDRSRKGMPSPVITFHNAWNVMEDKVLARAGKHSESYILAEGYIDGKLAASDKRMPSRRPSKIELVVDDCGKGLIANGSDFVTVVAQVTDDNGNVKRLNNHFIRFEVEGEGVILGGEDVFANPRPVIWGEAPILVRATTKAGKIRIKAYMVHEGLNMPHSAAIEIESVIPPLPMIYDLSEAEKICNEPINNSAIKDPTVDKQSQRSRLKEVERQQQDFE